MKVVAFYTAEYERELQGLKNSCEEHGYDYYFKHYESQGNWQKNTYIKPAFILEMLEKFPDDDILYLDADAVIKGKLTFFEGGIEGDFSMYIAPQNPSWPKSEAFRYLSGTMYFTNNQKARNFVNAWIYKREKYPKLHGDQALIPFVLREDDLNIKLTPLPIEYVKIFDKQVPCGEPVIIHNQASRRLKKKVNMNNKRIKVAHYEYTTNKEVEKYDAAHSRGEIKSNCLKYIKWSKPRLKIYLPNIIDLGCGMGDLKNHTIYKTYTGVDIAKDVIENLRKDAEENDVFIHQDISQVSTEQGFDVAYCLDTLQHLPEELIHESLERIKAISKTQIISVDCKKSKVQGNDRAYLNLTVHTPEWWENTLKIYLDIQESKITDSGIIFFCGDNYQLPDTVVSVPFNIRRNGDGSYWLPRRDRQKEAYMDKHFTRCGRQRKWYPKVSDDYSVSNLTAKAKGQTVYIVGKGPSLDNVTKDLFLDKGPVLAINESVNKIHELDLPNRVYLVQQDAGLSCHPQDAVILNERIQYAHPHVNERYLFNKYSFNTPSDPLSVIAAIRIAKIMGAKEIVLIAFDASTNKKVDYAECIGHKPRTVNGNTAQRFLSHRTKILQEVGKIPTKWLTP